MGSKKKRKKKQYHCIMVMASFTEWYQYCRKWKDLNKEEKRVVKLNNKK